jgi:galactose mutarotase-like enzyme
MGQHGFARDMDFEMEEKTKTEDTIWFVLRSSVETKKKYPYDFVLKLGYHIQDTSVEVLWQVENPSTEVIPFSIGGHPAFNCPIKEGVKQTDCFIRMDVDGPIVSTRLEGGLASDKQDRYELQDGYLPVTEHLFDHDALIIEDQKVKTVSLCDENKQPYLTVEMSAPLFGIWSPTGKHAPFICIEPWYGRCDPAGYEGHIRERKWENLLDPEDVWENGYWITV